MAILDFIKSNQTSTSSGTVSVTSTQPIVPQYIATKPAVQLVPDDDTKQQMDSTEQKRKDFVSSLLNVAAPGVVAGSAPSAVAVPTSPQTPVPNGAAHESADAKDITDGKQDAKKTDEMKSDEKKTTPENKASNDAKPDVKPPTDLSGVIATPGAPPVAGGAVSKDPVSHPELSRQALLDIMTHMTARANKCLALAQNKAKEIKSTEVDSEHLLAGLLADQQVYKLLTEMKVDMKKVEVDLAAVYKRGETATNPQLSARLKRILEVSMESARKVGLEFIAPEHLLIGLFEDGEAAGARVLANNGINKEELTKKILGDAAKKDDPNAKDPNAPAGPGGEVKQSALAQFTIDVTAKAQRGELDPVVERAEEIERVVQVLSRRTKNNPALVGEPGVGKTAIVEGLAQRIASGQVPERLMGKKILELDLMGILAGASHRGDFEQRMKDLIEEVVASQGGIIMFIDEMHTLVGAGGNGDGSLDAANFLKPALARGDLQMIGATTITEYRKHIEKDPALERRFQTVTIDEPTEEAAIKMLAAIAPKYADFHKVQIPLDTITAAVKLSRRYVGDRFLPDKAIDLIDEASSALRLPLMSLPEDINSLEARLTELNAEKVAAEQKGDTVHARVLSAKIAESDTSIKSKRDELVKKQAATSAIVTEEHIKDVVSRWTGIPISKLSESETSQLTQLEKIMHKRMIGQERPVKSVAAAVRRGRAGLKSNKRPIGSFIFLGPTGVGKTELAKTLAEILFGQEDALIRFDMTEFMEKHEVAKLLGPPPGYVGYEEGGKLTELVRRKPYSVVLFDEIEKAHPDIFNILLQVLDDGRLTDNKGRTISFKNTVIICTSNIGTQLIQDHLLAKAQGTRDDKEATAEELEVEAGSQSDKLVGLPEDLSHEYTGMTKDQIAPAYQTTKPNLDELELPSGYQYEDELSHGLGADEYLELKNLVMGELRKFFRPELINRFDEVIVFEPLQLSHMKKIVELQIKALSKLLEEQNMGITLTDEAKEQIVQEGFDPIYGARPLRRAMQTILENPISELIIAQKAKDGDIINTDFSNGSYSFEMTHPKPPEVQKVDTNTDKKSTEAAKSSDSKTLEYQKLEHFACAVSGYEFDTPRYPNSTVICPKNPSEKVISKAKLAEEPAGYPKAQSGMDKLQVDKSKVADIKADPQATPSPVATAPAPAIPPVIPQTMPGPLIPPVAPVQPIDTNPNQAMGGQFAQA